MLNKTSTQSTHSTHSTPSTQPSHIRVEYVFDSRNYPCRRLRDKMYAYFGNKVEYVDWNIPRVRAIHRHRKVPFLRFSNGGVSKTEVEKTEGYFEQVPHRYAREDVTHVSKHEATHFVEGKDCLRLIRKWIDDKVLSYPEFRPSKVVRQALRTQGRPPRHSRKKNKSSSSSSASLPRGRNGRSCSQSPSHSRSGSFSPSSSSSSSTTSSSSSSSSSSSRSPSKHRKKLKKLVAFQAQEILTLKEEVQSLRNMLKTNINNNNNRNNNSIDAVMIPLDLQISNPQQVEGQQNQLGKSQDIVVEVSEITPQIQALLDQRAKFQPALSTSNSPNNKEDETIQLYTSQGRMLPQQQQRSMVLSGY